jgi:hypothetical protein
MAAAVEPLCSTDPLGRSESARENVVSLVDYLGPISPELVLIDPELAHRARALLPELPSSGMLRSTGVVASGARASAPSTGSFSISRSISRPRPGAVVVAAALLAVTVYTVGLRAHDMSRREATTLLRAPVAAEPMPPVADAATLTHGSSPRLSATPRTSVDAPRFVWPRYPRAAGYRLALFRAGREIFEHDVAVTSFEFPTAWTYDGRFERLTPGAYRWIVWPLLGSLDHPVLGEPIVAARYSV